MFKGLLFMSCVLTCLGACQVRSKVVEVADFGFFSNCDYRASPALEEQLIGFLRQQGFDSLNLGAIQRKHGVSLYDLNITALDSHNRIIEIFALPHTSSKLSFALFSEPPTRHDTQLEQSLLSFASTGIGCRASQVGHGDNGPSAKDFHAQDVRRVQGLFKEAKELDTNGA
jgi:hypothetical protein